MRATKSFAVSTPGENCASMTISVAPIFWAVVISSAICSRGAGKIEPVFLNSSLMNLDVGADDEFQAGRIAASVLCHSLNSIEHRLDTAQRNTDGKPAVGLGCDTL